MLTENAQNGVCCTERNGNTLALATEQYKVSHFITVPIFYILLSGHGQG